MKKGLRRLFLGESAQHGGNGPRPYEEGIKTNSGRVFVFHVRTDPDLMKKGLRQNGGGEVKQSARTDPDLMKKGLRRSGTQLANVVQERTQTL